MTRDPRAAALGAAIAGLVALAALVLLLRPRAAERSALETAHARAERTEHAEEAAPPPPGAERPGAEAEPAVPRAGEPAPVVLGPSVEAPPRSPTPPGTPSGPGAPTASGSTTEPTGAPAPPPAPGDEPPRGSLPPEAIRSVVRDALPELRFCFEWQLSLHPELGGRLVMELTIDEDGVVSSAHVAEDLLADETVSRCFSHVIGQLRFPRPDPPGEVLVRYPFVLSGAPAAREPEGI